MKFTKVIITLTNNEEVIIKANSDACSDIVTLLDDIFGNDAEFVYKASGLINEDSELNLANLVDCNFIDSSTRSYVKLSEITYYHAVEADDEDEEA